MGYVLFSDSITWATQFQCTIFLALVLLLPLSSAVLSSGADGVQKFFKRWKKSLGAAVFFALLFDWASVVQYTVHTSGAIVVTG